MNEKRIDYIFSYEQDTEDEAERAEKWKSLAKEMINNDCENPIKVSYDGYSGELTTIERREFGPCSIGLIRVSYGIWLYDNIACAPYHITGVKLEDMELSGCSVSFEDDS